MSAGELRLPDDQLERLADLVAERLAGAAPMPRAAQLVDARTVAAAIGRSAEFVRDHADELGVIRQGTGPRPRLAFNLDRAMSAWASRDERERSHGASSRVSAGRRVRRAHPSSGTSVDLLPIRGRQ